MEDKIKQIIEVLRVFEKSDFTALRVEIEGATIEVSKDGSDAPRLPVPAALKSLQAIRPVVAAAVDTPEHPRPPISIDGNGDDSGLIVVRAPMLGTFYRAPSPGEAPFVEVGDVVERGRTVCLIECMKLFNTIEAGCAGTVERIGADNGAMVEFDQPLIYIRPK